MRTAMQNKMNVEIKPIKLEGNWAAGFALDLHTSSSKLLSEGKYDTTYTPIGKLLHGLKYENKKEYVDEIADIAGKLVEDYFLKAKVKKKIDVIIPVPPAKHNRTYQPVELLAQKISIRTGIKCSQFIVKRRMGYNEIKKEDDPTKREKALKDAFFITTPKAKAFINGKYILLLDDVYRSGETLNAIGMLLRQSGARCVYVLTVTKTRTKR